MNPEELQQQAAQEAAELAGKFFPTDTGVEQPETQPNIQPNIETPEIEKKEDEGDADAVPTAPLTDESDAVRKIKAEISARTQAKREAQSEEERQAIAEEQRLLRIALARTVAQEEKQRQLDTDDEYDEEDLQLITKYAKKLGFVTKEELEQQKQAELAKQRQVENSTKLTNAFNVISKNNPVLSDQDISSHIMSLVSDKLGDSVNILSDRALIAEFEDTLGKFGIDVQKEPVKVIPKGPQFGGSAPSEGKKVLKTELGEYDMDQYKDSLTKLGLRF